MSRMRSTLARALRRMVLAYHVACAREEARRRGLQVPAGLWRCEQCRVVLWDRRAFAVHSRLHVS